MGINPIQGKVVARISFLLSCTLPGLKKIKAIKVNKVNRETVTVKILINRRNKWAVK